MWLNSSIILAILLIIITANSANGKACPGKCMENSTLCNSKGGKVVGYCRNELACCDFTVKYSGSCGEIKSGHKSATFQSPDYPDFSSGELSCNFQFDLANISHKEYDAIMVDFEDVYMEGTGFVQHSPCETDMIFIRGFKFWQPPARCGNLTGYVALIDRTKNSSWLKVLNILAVMSGFRYKWKIHISLIHKHTFSKNGDKTGEHPEEINNELQNHALQNIGNSDILQNSEDANLDIIEPVVVNGEATDITKVPWQASIRTFYPDYFLKQNKANDTEKYNREKDGCAVEGRHFCGGSIISNRHILTAAHCFHPQVKSYGWKKVDHTKIYLGETDLCENDEVKYGRKSQIHSIEKVIFHYAYDDANMLLHDVVVLKLRDKITFNDYIKPIALSKRNKVYSGHKAKVSGWGLTNLTQKGVSLPLILQATDKLLIENRTYCNGFLEKGWTAEKDILESYPKYYNAFETVMCTRSKNDTVSQLVGQGDSGGPLIILNSGDDKTNNDKNGPVQIGIVSYGLPGLEAEHVHENVFVDFFQDVAFYREWIDLAMSI